MATETIRVPGQLSYSIKITGARQPRFRDVYHALLRMAWWRLIALISIAFLLANALFAVLYMAVGGIANAQPGSFWDAFFFSVQTMGTIGYGAMYPASRAANAVVVLESIVGLLITAVATGLVFVRFSLTKGRIVFAHNAAIGPMDGVPTLMIRFGNDRTNQIYDSRIALMLTNTVRTLEGVPFYRNVDLRLMRNRAPVLARSWTALHQIDEGSPLYRQTPESLAQAEAEIMISVSGIDDTSLQPVHGRWVYDHSAIKWGARLADILSETAEGDVLLDLSRFHDLTPTEPTEKFPWPKSSPVERAAMVKT
jgi:inward rectifier potassium channel